MGITAGDDQTGGNGVRGVKEETGHWARVIQWLEDLKLGADADSQAARFYLMEAAEDTTREKKPWPVENRQRQWLTPAEAKKVASIDETEAGSLLEKAETIRL